MPEGHTVHRTANDFNRVFGGQKVTIDSPQGRFSLAAESMSGRKLLTASAIGKQLFLEFDNERFIRIHLGIYGKWKWHQEIGKSGFLEQPSIGEVRVRFHNGSDLAELRGPTICEVIDASEVQAIHDRLGPDPINPDVDGSEANRFVQRVKRSNQPIAALLMDQSVISGIGNVYRAELLFRAGLDPYLPGKNLSDEQLIGLWEDAVRLLAVGVKTGFMITREELFEANPDKSERNFIYKRQGDPCRVCGTDVSIAILAGRKLYWCAGCQRS
ncbi:MAG: hypothetical protein RJA35_238 [Actinomycetota bacterium]|jgi:endonuclease-8